MGGVIVLFIVLIIAGTVIGSLYRKFGAWNRAYEKLGKKYVGKSGKGSVTFGFPFVSKPSFRFDYGRTYCSVKNRKSFRIGGGKHTEVTMLWPDKKLGVDIGTAPVKTSRYRRNFKQVEIENPRFQSDYYVTSNQPDAALSLLSQGVQWQLDQLKRLGGDAHLVISISRGVLSISRPGYIKNPVLLEDFVRHCLELFDHMMLTNAQGLDFVNDNMATVVSDVKCPICSEEITVDLVVCVRCKTPHCRDCWEYNGKCATFACNEKRFLSIGSASVPEV